ncbi:MAG: DUF4097 family beta strand repeat protein [Candidatus Krumholzibacteriota bacterium]|nr:DUF4097 family beta strand repeat protein [Candidatus Krumholzibacteriota bacterium]
MRTLCKVLLVFAAVATVLPAGGEARRRRPARTDEKAFDGIERIEIKVVTGRCVVTKSGGDKVTVRVESRYDDPDAVEIRIDRDDDVLEIEEEFHDSSDGYCEIYVTVPDGIEIDFNSASGGMSIEGVTGEFAASTASGGYRIEECAGRFRLSTASGDYRIEKCTGRFRLSTASGDVDAIDCRGDFDMSTASGDVDAIDCRGDFELSTASGNVDARGIVIEGDSEFSTASGKATVVLASSPDHDISVGSASGDAILDFDGNEVKGYVEMTAKKRGGRIKCPFDFDDEETFRRGGNRDTYVRKTVTIKSERPVVTIGTASGAAVLKK